MSPVSNSSHHDLEASGLAPVAPADRRPARPGRPWAKPTTGVRASAATGWTASPAWSTAKPTPRPCVWTLRSSATDPHPHTDARVERLETDDRGRQVTAVVTTLRRRLDPSDSRATWLSCPAAPSIQPYSYSSRPTTPIPTVWPTDRIRWAETTSVTTTWRSWPSPARPNPTRFQKTLALNDWYLKGEDWDYPWGSIQMLGKSDGEQIRAMAPHFLAWGAKITPRGIPGRQIGPARRRLLDVLRGPAPPRQPVSPSTRTATVRLTVPDDNNTEALAFLRKKFDSMLADLGFHKKLHERGVYLHEGMNIAATAHQAGTARFGSDPCDAPCST